MRASAVALQATDDALVAEELASLLVASLSMGAPDGSGGPTERAVAAVQTLEQTRAVGTLLAIRAVTEGDLRDLVDETLRRLNTRQVLVVPDWAERLGRVDLVETLHITEMLRDQDLWLLLFRYTGDEGSTSHLLTVSVDRNRGGVIGDITLAHPATAHALLEGWRSAADRHPDLSAMASDPAEVSMALATALARMDITIGVDITPMGAGLLPLLRARMRALPPVELSREELAWRRTDNRPDPATLAAEFAASAHAADLPGGVDSARVARHFLEATTFADDPLRWSPTKVETLLVKWLPTKVVLTPAEIEAVPDILRAFVRWALERGDVPEHGIAATASAVARWEKDFVEGMAGESGRD